MRMRARMSDESFNRNAFGAQRRCKERYFFAPKGDSNLCEPCASIATIAVKKSGDIKSDLSLSVPSTNSVVKNNPGGITANQKTPPVFYSTAETSGAY